MMSPRLLSMRRSLRTPSLRDAITHERRQPERDALSPEVRVAMLTRFPVYDSTERSECLPRVASEKRRNPECAGCVNSRGTPGAVRHRAIPPGLAASMDGPSAAGGLHHGDANRSDRARVASLHRRVRPHDRRGPQGQAARPITQLAGTVCQPVLHWVTYG